MSQREEKAQEIKLKQRETWRENKQEKKDHKMRPTLETEGTRDGIKLSFPCRTVAAGLSILIERVSH